MAASPAVQERTRPSFSLRRSFTRRAKGSGSKNSNQPQKGEIAWLPPVPQLSGSELKPLNFKYAADTTPSNSTEPPKPSSGPVPSENSRRNGMTGVDTSPSSGNRLHGRSSQSPSGRPAAESSPNMLHSSTTPKITVSTFKRNTELKGDISYQRDGLQGKGKAQLDKARSYSLTSFTRRPWNSPAVSRSPSPHSPDKNSSNGDDSTAASSVSSASVTNPDGSNGFKGDDQIPPAEGQKLRRSHTSTSAKRSRRLSLFSKNAPLIPELPPLLPIPTVMRSASVDASVDTPPSAPSSTTNHKKIKDELWEAYKTLENEYQRYQSKSNAQKTNVIRQSLLPFLRRFIGKPSRNIPPEELEKRARTLHRWWTGLLAQLRSRNIQAIAGADRPAYLEAISYIMSRPEWRSAPSSFAPLHERVPLTAKSGSSTSLSSSTSSFSLQNSVQHNIKVLFTRTLYDTLAYTVEKMSLRTAPPVLVALGGKVIAYAFYFCPGVAEMLIGLWELHPSTVRRVLPEFGIGRGADLKGVSDGVLCEFPDTLHHMGFTTLASAVRRMRKAVTPPVAVQVDWHGSWKNRWCGHDSDLLFVFFKHYHILMCDYLPPDATLAARLCAPGYVYVLAQTLLLVDNTVHRQPLPGAVESMTASTTFEDVLNATAALPLPVRNEARTMAENKLVLLLQDMLFDNNCLHICREFFAQSFVAMLKAAVRRTGLYDSDACFMLYDLVEELLPLLSRAAKQGIGDYIDWKFWLEVAQTMLQSENNMTELRVLSFLYTMWDILVEDAGRKETVCLKWLLSTPIWERFFCHWCPMVRAYYMRLLCWKLGRYDGDASELDVEIFKTVLLRLRSGYAHHTQLKKNFERCGGKPSSTAPCLPAPSRRLVILRNDSMVSPQGVLLDGMVPSSVPFVATPGSLLRTHSTISLASLADSDACSVASSTRSDETIVSNGSRKWSQIRTAFGFKSQTTSDWRDSPDTAERGSVSSGSSTDSTSHDLNQPQRQANFKFSLEWIDRPMFARERILGPPRLAAPTQRYLESLTDDVRTVEVSAKTLASKHWTYIGRALSEWLLVIVEYENFFDRRKMEGRETDKDVETPSLGVESIRKF